MIIIYSLNLNKKDQINMLLILCAKVLNDILLNDINK